MRQRSLHLAACLCAASFLLVSCAGTPPPKSHWVWETAPKSSDWRSEFDPERLAEEPESLAKEPSSESDSPDLHDWRAWQPTNRLDNVEPLILRWPVQTTGITSHYGPRMDPISGRPSFHFGLDMAGNVGDTVRASLRGTVIRASSQGGHGQRVVLRHPWGYTTSYSHLSKIFVRPGDPISKGQPIGEIGATGRATGPHLHFELHHNGNHLDPLNFLGESLPLMREHISQYPSASRASSPDLPAPMESTSTSKDS